MRCCLLTGRTLLPILYLSLFIAGASFAHTTFQRTYIDGIGFDAIETAHDKYMILGQDAGGIVLLKVNVYGDTVWTRNFSHPDTAIKWSGNALFLTVDSGFVIAGSEDSLQTGGADMLLLKTDSAGQMQWVRTYGAAGDAIAYDVVQDASNGYVIAGRTSGAGESDLYIVRTDTAGDTVWTRTYGDAGLEYGKSIVLSPRQTFTVLANTNSFGQGSMDAWLLRMDLNGGVEWSHTFGADSMDFGMDLVLTRDSGYAFTGYTYNRSAGIYNSWLVRTDRNGDTLWTRTYHPGYEQKLYGLFQSADRGFVVGGHRMETNGPDFDQSIYVSRVDLHGDTVWTRIINESPQPNVEQLVHSAFQTTDGGFLFAGTYGEAIYLLKTNGNGHSPALNDTAESIVPEAPTMLEASLLSGEPGQFIIELEWQDNSNDETGFLIKRLNDTIPILETIDTIPADSTRYYDTVSLNDKTYTYRLVAFNNVGNSTYSNLATVTTGITGMEMDPPGGERIDVFPNPLSEPLLHIRVEGMVTDNPLELVIINLTGQAMLKIRVAPNDHVTIPTFGWPSGLYFYSLNASGDVKASGKILVH